MSDVHDGNPNEIIERPEPVEGQIMTSMESSNLDIQITTAKKYPRNVKRAMQAALEMATLNEEVAADCCYAIPRGGKMIEGPSVRLAEIIASAWGNLHAATRVSGDTGKSVVAEAVAWDMERNVRIGAEAHVSVLDKFNKRYTEDMVRVTGAAAMSKALRNAIFRVVPNAFVQDLYRTCKRVAMGDEKTLSARRTEVLAYFQKLGVKTDRLFVAIGITSEMEIGLEQLAKLRGVATSIKTGETTIDDAFPDPTGAQEAADKKAGTGNKALDLSAELKAKREAAGIKTEPIVTTTPGPTTVVPTKPAAKKDAKAPTTLPGLTEPPDTEGTNF